HGDAREGPSDPGARGASRGHRGAAQRSHRSATGIRRARRGDCIARPRAGGRADPRPRRDRLPLHRQRAPARARGRRRGRDRRRHGARAVHRRDAGPDPHLAGGRRPAHRAVRPGLQRRRPRRRRARRRRGHPVTFLSTLALAVAVLVVAPYMAHRLRRRRAEEQPFPPARLVEPSAPKARRRSRLEDRALFATRAAAVLLLALLGATPFVRCSRLSLQRSGGASVAMAIVVDDSMSMRASAGRTSRFERARDGARELLASAREGDAVALVLAGVPPRVALAPTSDLGAAKRAIETLSESDRATDLDGALALARGLVASLPQIDRRIVVLSDLADGRPDAPPLGEGSPVPVWVAL